MHPGGYVEMPGTGPEATIPLKTYYHYAGAWVVALEREYGRTQTCMEAFNQGQQSLDAFKRLQSGQPRSRELIAAFPG